MARHYLMAGLLVLVACADREVQAPMLKRYQWPESFAYRLEQVVMPQRNGEAIGRLSELRVLYFEAREGGFLLGQDSVVKLWEQPGAEPSLVAPVPEDTLLFTVALDRWGLIGAIIPGCDPVVTACSEALPSAVRLLLREIVPRLPLWEAPAGASWTDTVEYDDVARPRGTRGALVTTYTAAPDTVIGGVAYAVLTWSAQRTSFRRGGVAAVALAEPPVRTDGVTYLDKRRSLPVYAVWAGVAMAPADLRAIGATASGFRGRAYLQGSGFPVGEPAPER